ncbi:hypothetical protein E2C01_044958 [Portunus trituberculatus]|uniref:Uncharacterized protein n=1 Tax=Portunus trituberculatus TaxID=210409 RepID=A0A5B7G0U0_PORTR|nr:hypothetical protein [Portunus trituberculatus]
MDGPRPASLAPASLNLRTTNLEPHLCNPRQVFSHSGARIRPVPFQASESPRHPVAVAAHLSMSASATSEEDADRGGVRSGRGAAQTHSLEA